VLAHEQAHRRGGHGLVNLLARFLTAGLAPLPAAGLVAECLRRHLEALADDAAARRHGRETVGVALGRIALAAYPAAGLGASGASLWRVRRLIAPTPAPCWPDRLLLVTSAATLAAGLVAAAADAAAALGPVANASFCPL
jgi:Zn-dependent protease with chaperone function